MRNIQSIRDDRIRTDIGEFDEKASDSIPTEWDNDRIPEHLTVGVENLQPGMDDCHSLKKKFKFDSRELCTGERTIIFSRRIGE